MPWLLSKLASQLKLVEGEETSYSSADSSSTFWENILEPEEESQVIEASRYA
jgi:malonyl-CoA decarboxylase